MPPAAQRDCGREGAGVGRARRALRVLESQRLRRASASVVFAGGVSLAWLLLMIRLAAGMVDFMLRLSIVLNFVLAGVLYARGAYPMYLIFLVLAMLNCCYYYCVRDRIPFAGANLEAACTAVKQHMGTVCASAVALALNLGWCIVWVGAVAGINHSQNGELPRLAIFGLLVALYWGQQVWRNISAVTTAGAVGSWWFDANNHSPVTGSLRRACTWSFGSICYERRLDFRPIAPALE